MAPAALSSITEGRHELKAETMEGHHIPAYSWQLLLSQHSYTIWSTSPGVSLATAGWVLLHQLAIKKMNHGHPTGQSGGGNPLRLPQIILVFIKFAEANYERAMTDIQPTLRTHYNNRECPSRNQNAIAAKQKWQGTNLTKKAKSYEATEATACCGPNIRCD